MQTENKKYPEIVYKYRNWTDTNHRNILLKNEIFFTSPKNFNDPFDCKIPVNLSLLNTEDKIQDYMDKKRIQRTQQSEEELKNYEFRIRNEPEKVQADYEELYSAGVDKHYGVLSLSKRWDSILMWSHYADHHKGFCIGYWEEKFRKSNLQVMGGPVSYPPNNDYPQIDPMLDHEIEFTIQQINTKSKEWQYESEFRLTKISYPNELNDFNRKEIIPDHFFAEIIIGLKATNETQEELKQIGKSKNIKVFQVKKVPFKYEITREEIL